MPLARIFTVKDFDRFVRKERLANADLIAVVESIERGAEDAKLGAGLFKQRIPRVGSGKAGGYRTIVVFRDGDRAVFVEGSAKNVKKVYAPDELKSLRSLAADLLNLSQDHVYEAVVRGGFREIER